MTRIAVVNHSMPGQKKVVARCVCFDVFYDASARGTALVQPVFYTEQNIRRSMMIETAKIPIFFNSSKAVGIGILYRTAKKANT